jgi:hypothetical protein
MQRILKKKLRIFKKNLVAIAALPQWPVRPYLYPFGFSDTSLSMYRISHLEIGFGPNKPNQSFYFKLSEIFKLTELHVKKYHSAKKVFRNPENIIISSITLNHIF